MFGKNKKGNVSDSEYGAMLGGHLNFAASEAYKLLRTNLMYALTGEETDECRVVGVTSSVRGEGKSTTTLNLAYSIAEAGSSSWCLNAICACPPLQSAWA